MVDGCSVGEIITEKNEHRTLNVEHRMFNWKKELGETYRWKTEKDERPSFKTLVGIGCLFLIRCWMFDVHLIKNPVNPVRKFFAVRNN